MLDLAIYIYVWYACVFVWRAVDLRTSLLRVHLSMYTGTAWHSHLQGLASAVARRKQNHRQWRCWWRRFAPGSWVFLGFKKLQWKRFPHMLLFCNRFFMVNTGDGEFPWIVNSPLELKLSIGMFSSGSWSYKSGQLQPYWGGKWPDSMLQNLHPCQSPQPTAFQGATAHSCRCLQ